MCRVSGFIWNGLFFCLLRFLSRGLAYLIYLSEILVLCKEEVECGAEIGQRWMPST